MRQRTTPQLAAVTEVLATARDHPTAVEIFRRVRRRLPRVSLGTVYRNLDKLRAQGRVRVIRLGGEAYFDGVLAAHDHFICEHCRAVADLPGPTERPDPRRLPAGGCIARWQQTAIYGLCAACATATASRPAARRTGRQLG